MKKAAKKKSGERMAIIGNEGYGLYYGRVIATDEEIMKSKSVRVYECRHIRYWYGKPGGITSLAAFGPCGPRVAENRIGAPCPSTLITEVKAVHECSPEAVAAFAAVVVS